MIPSKSYRNALKEGMQGHEIWALQINLNARGYSLVEDGDFGPATAKAVITFQTKQGLKADGIAGVLTQRALALLLIAPAQQAHSVPDGIIKGLVEGESGFVVGAVNWSVPGGVDCGYVQRRIYEGDYNDASFHKAFDGKVQFDLTASTFRSLKDGFYGKPGATTHRRAWELAVLSHNWPAGASTLASGKSLSTNEASWVIAIGVPGVRTPAQWADFYIASKTQYVESWAA